MPSLQIGFFVGTRHAVSGMKRLPDYFVNHQYAALRQPCDTWVFPQILGRDAIYRVRFFSTTLLCTRTKALRPETPNFLIRNLD